MRIPFDSKKPLRILIFRTDRLGDLVLSTPVFEAVKSKYPKAYTAVLVSSGLRGVVEKNPFIDEVLACGRGISWPSVVHLRAQKFDMAVHLNPSSGNYWMSFLAGIPVRIGYRVKNHFLLTHAFPELKQYGRKHEAEYNFDLLNPIGIEPPAVLKTYFPLTSEDRKRLKIIFDFNQPYAVFHPSASCLSKIWPPERFGELADQIYQAYRLFPVIVGEGEGVVHVERMEKAMTAKPVRLSGKLSTGMLAWLLKESRILISNDSGPVHLAGAVGTPVISIFGRNRIGLNPERWKPVSEHSSYVQKDVGCVECLAHRCRIDFLCLKSLQSGDVFEEVKKYEPFFHDTLAPR